MMEDAPANPPTDEPACQGQGMKDNFWNAQASISGLVLVVAIRQEGNQIHGKEPDQPGIPRGKYSQQDG